MGWLALGVLYSLLYVTIGWSLENLPVALLWFRAAALLMPPLAGVVVIVRRRHAWTGCHWLFWSTIVLGLTMSALGQLGWTAEEIMMGSTTSWLGWHAVFALFGAVAPLLALLAQPHRGPRDRIAATTAVDIAGIAVLTGFLYSYFVITPDLTSVRTPSTALVLLSELQQFLVMIGITTAALLARRSMWKATYARLALGQLVAFATLTLSNFEMWQASYRAAGVLDFIRIMPFAFYPWAAAAAPTSEASLVEQDDTDLQPSRPWVIFCGLALIPVLDSGLRLLNPAESLGGFRDLTMAVTVVSVLPLLMARLAVERGELNQVGAELKKADTKVQLMAAAIEQADEMIVIVGRDHGIEHANEAFCRTFGCGLPELIGTDGRDLLAEDSRPQFDETVGHVGQTGLWRGTYTRQRKDGSTFPSAAAIVPLRDAAGTVDHLVIVERDITEESRLKDQLIHSERLSAVGQLVSGVAHELNNPLQSILGFTELLIETEQRQQNRRDLEQIRSEAVRAGKIVRNLLAFVRRSSSERSLQNVNDLLRSTLALRVYEFDSANIKLVEDYGEDLPPVWVNPEEIQQVVLNLILNAEHAMRATHEGGTLTLRTFVADANVVAEVRDDGPGIPQKLAGRIFEPFFSTKGVGEGTGLGLSIALGIAEAHGGLLSIVPTPSGACFRLTIPASRPAAGASADAELASLVDVSASAQRVLVADDEPALRATLQRLLMQRGLTVDLAVDGDVALSLLEAHRYDLVFCDVRLPKSGGLALYTRIVERYGVLARGFILISTGRLDADTQAQIDRARIPVLSKPFSPDQLEELIGRLVVSSV